MNELKLISIRLIEMIGTLMIGFLFTLNILKPIYEHFGIPFRGNVWVNWFGISYILFVLYTLLLSLLVFEESIYFKSRRTSIVFWLILIVAIYAVFIPFVKGENPF